MSYGENEETRQARYKANTKLGVKITVGVVVSLLAVVFLFMLVMPQINLYKANTEKKALIAEAKAKRAAAFEFAQAEVERAKGVAESNKIVAESINENYIRYLYIQAIEGNQNQIIYVPTEAGLPILEANRMQPAP